jgi:hypothetical protein
MRRWEHDLLSISTPALHNDRSKRTETAKSAPRMLIVLFAHRNKLTQGRFECRRDTQPARSNTKRQRKFGFMNNPGEFRRPIFCASVELVAHVERDTPVWQSLDIGQVDRQPASKL